MQCQREGCDNDADYAVQIMSQRGYRVGLCRDCAIIELRGIGALESGLDLLDSTECHIILEADWWREHFFWDNLIQCPFTDKEKYVKYVIAWHKARAEVKGKKERVWKIRCKCSEGCHEKGFGEHVDKVRKCWICGKAFAKEDATSACGGESYHSYHDSEENTKEIPNTWAYSHAQEKR